ncbi:MAG: 50S ribosomal protein L22 [Bacteroidetes bacterium]|nr:50S ribosomal protein L22 [Bacteroidota bacterium]
MESVAKLKNSPYPARKMRLLADLVRGKAVTEALSILKYHKKVAYAGEMEKLLKSAVNNWEQRNEDMDINEVTLVVKTVMVDEGKTLKRIQPAPQGRAHRVRKRSNHITVVVSTSQVGNGQNPVNNQPNDDNN